MVTGAARSAATALAPWMAAWRLIPDGEAFDSRFGNHLAPVLADGVPAMLKVAVGEEERRGAALMSWYAGDGAARVLAHEGAAILLERALGDRRLAQMAAVGDDDEASRILCDVLARLHVQRAAPPPYSLVPLPAWFDALGPVAAAHGGVFSSCLAAAGQLLAEPRERTVLHGDVHHDNVLDGGARGWLAIDPKGLIGERAFDYANLFRNPTAEIALSPGRMRRQVDVVSAAADLEPRRLLTWIHAYAGLGTAWSLRSGHDPAPGLAIAEIAAATLGG